MKQKLDAHILWLTQEGKIKDRTANEIRDSFLEEKMHRKRKQKEVRIDVNYSFDQYASCLSEGTKKHLTLLVAALMYILHKMIRFL